jgi:amino acid transporter/mannitol/fructose-specific phosphotransferase system IIA component (Ntr-type)
MGPAMGTVAGILSWFSLCLKSAFALVGAGVLVAPILPVGQQLIAAGLAIALVLLNLVGVREAARFQVALVLALLGLMILFVVRGLPRIDVQHFEPFVPHGYKAVFFTTGFVFVSYGGLLKIASVAGEIKEPGRLVPIGMVLALISITILYALMITVTSGVLGAEELDHSLTPISDAAGVFMGSTGQLAISVGALLAFLTTANAGIMTASRYLFALSKDRLLPQPLRHVSARFKVPYLSVLITGLIALLAVFVELDLLVKAASTVFVLGYVLSSLCVIILRESGLQNYRPSFNTPLYPWTQLITVLGLSFVIVEMGEGAFLIMAGMIVIGFAIYGVYGRREAEIESALLHLVSRILTRDLASGDLESELKAIVRERDEIDLDRLDRIIENAPVLDIDRKITREQFFEFAAEQLAPRVNLHRQHLRRMLIEREDDISTVLSPTLAVPHIVIEQADRFEVLLTRCRPGVFFSHEAPEIHTIFVIVGSREQRNFYLRVLSAIAQVVQDPEFESQWMEARNEQALRDIVLLGERRRGYV